MIARTARSTGALLGLLAVSALWSLAPTGAAAQSACGPEIRIVRGDTLSRIARNCGVPERALREANPDIDWDLLRLGAPVLIPDRQARRPPVVERESRRGVYVIQRGDRLRDVADALGVDVATLLAVNPELSERDLVPGREVRLGERRERDRRGDGDRPRERDVEISVREDRVRPGDVATVVVDGLPPRVSVRLRAGPEGSRAIIFERTRSDRDGSAVVEIEVPEEARRGERWFVEALAPDRRPIARDGFRIAGRGADGDGGRGRTVVSGLLTIDGVECPTLRSYEGRLYSLSGDIEDFRPGDTVTVTGRLTDRSICQQGTTIEVRRIEADR